MRLPPLTFTEAARLYKRIVESDGDAIALIHPDDMVLHLAASLVTFGDHLKQAMDQIIERDAMIVELRTHLQAYVDDARASQLEATPAVVPNQETQITGVGWVGKPGDYFDRFPEINHELAKGISAMARQAVKREQEMRQHPSAIDSEAAESTVETPPEAT